MNYKLCQQLKKAKFPFDFKESEIGDDTYTYPTLEELIDACRTEFHHLNRCYWNGKIIWEAHPGSTNLPTGQVNIFGLGKTPSEAVAKLWLTLIKGTK